MAARCIAVAPNEGISPSSHSDTEQLKLQQKKYHVLEQKHVIVRTKLVVRLHATVLNSSKETASNKVNVNSGIPSHIRLFLKRPNQLQFLEEVSLDAQTTVIH